MRTDDHQRRPSDGQPTTDTYPKSDPPPEPDPDPTMCDPDHGKGKGDGGPAGGRRERRRG